MRFPTLVLAVAVAVAVAVARPVLSAAGPAKAATPAELLDTDLPAELERACRRPVATPAQARALSSLGVGP
jgi:hypothetical protein